MWTSAFPALPENVYFSGSFVVSSHSLSLLKMGSFSKILAILANSIVDPFACLLVRYSCNYSALPRVDESKATIKSEQ